MFSTESLCLLGPLNFTTYNVISHISYRGNWKLLGKFCFTQKVYLTHKFDHFSDKRYDSHSSRSLYSGRQPPVPHPPQLGRRRRRSGHQEKTTVCLQPGDAGAPGPPGLSPAPGELSPGQGPSPSLSSPGSPARSWSLHQETEEHQQAVSTGQVQPAQTEVRGA